MKKNIFIIAAFLVLFAISSSFGQGKTLYAKFYGAYGLFTPGSYKPVSYNYSYDGTASQSSFKVPKLGLGGGVRVGAGVGMVMNDFLNLGIDGEYHIGKSITSTSESNSNNYKYASNSSLDYTIFSIIPNITFKAISQPKYYIYTRLGPVIGIPLNMEGVTTSTEDYSGTERSTYRKTKYELKATLGYLAAIGVQVRISDAIRAFGEISAYGLSFNREKDEDTESYSENPTGSDPEPSVKNIIIYKSEGEYTYDYDAENLTDTRTQPQDPLNANAIAISVGLAFKL